MVSLATNCTTWAFDTLSGIEHLVVIKMSSIINSRTAWTSICNVICNILTLQIIPGQIR